MATIHIIIYIFILCLLFWLLQGYPQWRQKQLELTKSKASTVSDQTQQACSPKQQPVETISTDDDDDKDTCPPEEPDSPALTLTQYTMMIPMAVVYLIGRTVLDITRGCFYHALYSAELAAPAIDEWLFNKVTVWLPQKYDQAEEWWSTKGRQRYHALQHTLIYDTIPTMIDRIDTFFLHLYNGGQVVAETAHKVADSIRLFREKHDWRQLALDMGNAGYTLIGKPLISIMTHMYKLGSIFYQGCSYGIKATWDDLKWIVTVGVPGIVHWIGATRGWIWMNQGWRWFQDITKTVALKVAVASAPVLQWMANWMVRLGDTVTGWIQSDTMQRIWKYAHCHLSNWGMWICVELAVLVQSAKAMATAMVDHGIIPIVHLFMNHVLPRLSQGYQRFLVKAGIIYELYIQPVGSMAILWVARSLSPLSQLLEHYYLGLISFLSQWNWNGVWQVSRLIIEGANWVTTWTRLTAGPTLYKMTNILLYYYLPLTVEYVQHGWSKVMGELDYVRLASVLEQVYQVIQEQCSLLFASLERTMNDWKETQQDPDMRTDKVKANKVD